MEVFEIHLTAQNDLIHKVAQQWYHHTLTIDLLKPDGEVLRTEHMTAIRASYRNIDECLFDVNKIVREYEDNDIYFIRTKVESPYYDHYVGRSHYVEAHFPPFTNMGIYPESRNQRSLGLLCTAREYYQHKYEQFREMYRWVKGAEIELCLYDDYIGEDKDWMDLWKLSPLAKV